MLVAGTTDHLNLSVPIFDFRLSTIVEVRGLDCTREMPTSRRQKPCLLANTNREVSSVEGGA